MLHPRWYQQECCDSIIQNIKSEHNILACLPTGTGKSFVITMVIDRILSIEPNARILVCIHTKELVEQDYNTLYSNFPSADVGIYAAGLKRKQCTSQITFASIQSICKKADLFSPVDYMIVDECHRIDGDKQDSQYTRFISELKEKNSNFKLIGFTATPYRMGTGLLIDNQFLDFELVYDATSSETFVRLIDEGYLSNVTCYDVNNYFDVRHNVKVQNGEYSLSSMNDYINSDLKTEQVLQDVLNRAKNRKHILFFCCSIAHSLEVRDWLREHGQSAETVSSKDSSKVRDDVIKRFKNNEFRCLCNRDILTVGFDYPAIDCIVMLRPTLSMGLYQQMVGRGLRIHSEKIDCLLLDYVGNLFQHGAINLPFQPAPKPQIKDRQEEPDKELPKFKKLIKCPKCQKVSDEGITVCSCGFDFEFGCPHCFEKLDNPITSYINCPRCNVPLVKIKNLTFGSAAEAEIIARDFAENNFIDIVEDEVISVKTKPDNSECYIDWAVQSKGSWYHTFFFPERANCKWLKLKTLSWLKLKMSPLVLIKRCPKSSEIYKLWSAHLIFKSKKVKIRCRKNWTEIEHIE